MKTWEHYLYFQSLKFKTKNFWMGNLMGELQLLLFDEFQHMLMMMSIV